MKKINTPENLKNLVVNILIVDDSPVNLLIMKRMLEEPDYNILTATSGKSALKLMMNTEFALAILDIKMPDMDGFELARMIKTQDKIKDIPIIFMSAYYTDPKNMFKGYSLGCF